MVLIDIFYRLSLNIVDLHSYRPNSVGEQDTADRCPRAMPNYLLQLNQ